MSIKSQYLDPFQMIMEAVDSTRGAETTPIPMDYKDLEDVGSAAKVQEQAKIFVPESRREQVRDDIVDYLNQKLDSADDFGGSEVISYPNKMQLDLVIGYSGKKPQVIRLEVKPENRGGSGGGAAATKIQEVGMAVFTAIRYYKKGNNDLECHTNDPKKCLDSEDYSMGMSHVDCNNEVTVDEIMSLSQDWKNAFIMGANKIYKEVGGSGWEFVRGDKKVEKSISDAFGRVKSESGLASEDKWNPSDIWMVKDKDNIVELLKQENTINCLNNFISLAFTDANIPTESKKQVPRRSLVGLSLKKLGESPKWQIMNEPNVSQLKKAEGITYDKSATQAELTAFSGMDVYLCYGKGRFNSFQCRNFGGKNKGDWKLELKGKYAAQGKIQGQVMRDLLKKAKGFPDAPKEPNFSDCGKTSKSIMDSITDEIFNIMNSLPRAPKGFTKGTNKTIQANMKAEIRTKDASWRYSKLCGLRFLQWLNKLHKVEANRAMKEMYLYASSQTDKSSSYYKIY